MPKMKREIGGKDGREQGRLSSDERARLGGSQAADVSEVGADRVNVAAVEAACGIHQRTLLLFERKGEKKWEVIRAYPLPNSKDVVHTRTPAPPDMFGVEPLLVVHLEGKIVTTSDYRGCVYCLDRTVFRCGGCRTLNCMGASRPHDDHTDGLCGRCNKWYACGLGLGSVFR